MTASRRQGFLLLLLLTLIFPSCVTKDEPAPPTVLSESLEALAAQHAEKEIALAYQDLDSGRTVLRHGSVVFHAASTMKIAVMIEVFRQAEAGRLDLDGTIPVVNGFKSIVDGSPYQLSREDDSEQELDDLVGSQRGVRDLVERMMVRSSNLATNILIDRVGAQNVQKTIEALGTTRMLVLRGVEDTPAFEKGLNNVTTARDLMRLLKAIARNRAASPEACAQMCRILEAQQFNEMIPAGLPPGTRVAHKTGSITRIHHDAAIVYAPAQSPYVLVVLTRGFDDQQESARVVAEVSRLVFEQR